MRQDVSTRTRKRGKEERDGEGTMGGERGDNGKLGVGGRVGVVRSDDQKNTHASNCRQLSGSNHVFPYTQRNGSSNLVQGRTL